MIVGDTPGVTPPILTEVLQGFRADRAFERARAALVRIPTLALDIDGYVAGHSSSVPCTARG